MATIRECVNGLRVRVRVRVRLYVCLCACVQVCVFAHSWSDSEGIQQPRRKRDSVTTPINLNQVSVTPRSLLSAQIQTLRGHGRRRGSLGIHSCFVCTRC